MVIKGLDEKYLEKTEMTAEQIVNEIYDITNDIFEIHTITILSAGWDVYFGNYAVVRTAHNKHWVVTKGEVIPYNGFAKERDLL